MTAQAARILVADDDRALLDTLTWILKDRGYHVIPVPGGVDLMGQLEAERPDLLMLDIMMPKVDGLQLLEQVKQSERWRDLPVLMISSIPPEEATVRSLGLGAADFIAKPFRVKELVARVDAHLRMGRQLRDVRREADRRASEAAARAEMVDILHEVTEALAPEEMYHILARRVANVLKISKCSIILAKPGDEVGTVVVAADNPMLRNLDIHLARYPEIRKALGSSKPVLVKDVQSDSLYTEVRQQWAHEGITVRVRSVIAVPFTLREKHSGVFFLRTLGREPPLTESSLDFAEQVVETAVNAIERAYDLQTAESDKRRYQELATTDPLTGCVNRRALLETLEAELERVERYKLALSVLMIDIDRFKDVNDLHGHLVGDAVLRQVGEILRKEVRTVDVVARYGGEEFVILVPETGPEGARIFAERIRVRIAQHDFAEGHGEPLRITVSVGITSLEPGESGEPEAVIARADDALYRAKRQGRNRVSR